jgi:D-ribose pyranose/furanose isomerase RbsD
MRLSTVHLLVIVTMGILSCNHPSGYKEEQDNGGVNDWKKQFDLALPLLGHRNWIVVADKALPQQNAPGIEYINTGEKLLPVLQYVLNKINASGHVRPLIYRDKELAFISDQQAKGVKEFTAASQTLFGSQPVQTLLHDSVFTKLETASKLFKVLVIKTDETLPYSSVFLQLDCAYWSAENEKILRDNMKGQ